MNCLLDPSLFNTSVKPFNSLLSIRILGVMSKQLQYVVLRL